MIKFVDSEMQEYFDDIPKEVKDAAMEKFVERRRARLKKNKIVKKVFKLIEEMKTKMKYKR
jgi:hypothetical protein